MSCEFSLTSTSSKEGCDCQRRLNLDPPLREVAEARLIMGTGNATQRELAPAEAKARFFEPMLCLAVEKLPEGPAWQYEVKLDGYRAVGVRTKTGVELWSRNRKDFSRRFPEVTRALEALPGRCYWRHRDQEFIEFLNSLARRYPGRELHLICDNYGTHSHSAVGEWLAAHPLQSPLHSHQCLVAQSGRALVWFDQPAGDPARQFRQRGATGAGDHPIRGTLEPRRPAFGPDQDRLNRSDAPSVPKLISET
jgi:hypothetical protein